MLVERARVGSASAFAELIERHRDAAYTIVRNLCRTVADTEETLQQAFLTAWWRLTSFPAGSRFSTWLYSIATRTALADRLRRYPGQRTSHAEALLPAFDGEGRLIVGHTRRRESEATPAVRIDITATLRQALESIDDVARAALVLCDVLGLRPEEAAVIVETSPRSVRQHLHRARLFVHGFIDRLDPGALSAVNDGSPASHCAACRLRHSLSAR